jgi:SPX domain protein involved in polyphosphate accumulation
MIFDLYIDCSSSIIATKTGSKVQNNNTLKLKFFNYWIYSSNVVDFVKILILKAFIISLKIILKMLIILLNVFTNFNI